MEQHLKKLWRANGLRISDDQLFCLPSAKLSALQAIMVTFVLLRSAHVRFPELLKLARATLCLLELDYDEGSSSSQ